MAEYPIGQRYRGSGVTMPGIAGETVPRGATVYMSAVDGLWYLADSDAAATLPTVGIISDAGATGQIIQILVLGLIERNDWTWTRGDTLYTSGTAGVMTQVAPANAQPVAVALTATLIYVNTTLSLVGGGGVTHAYRYVYPIDDNASGGSNPPTVARVILRPVQVFVPMTVDRIGLRVITANGNGRGGIYRDNGDTPVGGALVVESASIALVVGVQEFTIASTVLTAGLYWIALQFDDNTAAINRTSQSIITTQASSTLRVAFYNRGGGYGAFTDPCPAVTATNNFPWNMYLRVVSVP